ncbi:MAG: type II toxin-antitoxin system VapC family toxin [Polyangiaceae bacterium]|nr:type II toxin-antitoxin system VapC family toxin [Polyangiaceae bacterium]
MGRRVYLETSVISYLAALPSRDVVVAGNQQVTRDWWARRDRFELFVSDAVVEEARPGDSDAARRRLALLDGVPVLTVHADAQALAERFLSQATLPSKAAIDAVHVALAAVHGMDFLVTWNCAHIANAVIRPQLEVLCWRAGYRPPVICTPLELADEDQE